MEHIRHIEKRAGVVPALVAGTLVALALAPTAVWSDGSTVFAPPPNGTDDTAQLQSSLDACVVMGPGCTVQLAAGRYLTKQLVVFNFRGAFRGRGKNATIIEALPNLPVDIWIAPSDTYWPPGTPGRPPSSLITFVDGDIHVSDLAVRITAIPSTQPYFLAADWQVSALIDAIRFTGIRRTNATVERVLIEGREDASDTGLFGFNVASGITYAGEFPTGSGIAFDYYQISGNFTVAASSFANLGAGVYPTIVKNGRVTIGGSPVAGNVMENVTIGMDLESLENSVVEVSHNKVLGAKWAAAWVIPWCCGFLPTKPSLFSFHHNQFEATGPEAFGIQLLDDPAKPWIRALIFKNTIDAQDIGSNGAISAFNTKYTTVWNNRISGTGGNGISIWDGSHGKLIGNDVASFTAAPGQAQIVLGGATTRSAVVCKSGSDTVLDQGTRNKLIGCQEVSAP